MKKTGKSHFLAGFVLGAALFGSSLVYAAGVAANLKSVSFTVNGKAAQVETYTINGRDYVKLSDIAEAVNFSVTYNNGGNRVIIDTSKGFEPVTAVTPTPVITTPVAPTPVTPTVPAQMGTPLPGVSERDLAVLNNANYIVSDNELEALRLVNAERQKAGLPSVTLDIGLCKAARIKAVEMAELKYLSHESPNYGLPKAMLETFGIKCNAIAENASYLGGTEACGVVYNWMRSDGHRKNVLNAKYRKAGIGLGSNGGLGYWSIIFTD